MDCFILDAPDSCKLALRRLLRAAVQEVIR